MSSKYARPKWWQVYLTFPLLIALFAVDSRLKLSTRGHQAVQIGIVLIVYGLIHLWIKANAKALSEMDRARYGGSVRVIKVPLYQLTDMEEPYTSPSVLQLPESEIKGTLSNTIEMDYIDAKSFPVNESHKN